MRQILRRIIVLCECSITTRTAAKVLSISKTSDTSRPHSLCLTWSRRRSGKGSVSGTRSWVKARLVVVATKPAKRNKAERKVLTGSPGILLRSCSCSSSAFLRIGLGMSSLTEPGREGLKVTSPFPSSSSMSTLSSLGRNRNQHEETSDNWSICTI